MNLNWFRVHNTSKKVNFFYVSLPGMLPRLETRVILVGEASRNDALIQALKVGYRCA